MDVLIWLEALSPLSGGVNALLLILSFLTSGLTAAVGIGGGSLLIMTMAQVMPASALIPVHGMVQLGSNAGRVGLITTFISNFVGASGPMVAGYLKRTSPERLVRVATQSAILTAQHISKAFVFGAAGFVFHQWLWLMLLMVATGFVGTWVGLRFLHQQSNVRFDRILTWMLTLLALRLLWMAVEKLLGH